jgi:hypothetical protein
MKTKELKTNKRLATVRQMPELYNDVFTAAAFRNLLFFKKQNGIDRCVIKIGKKVLIDLDIFEMWLDDQAEVKRDSWRKETKKEETTSKAIMDMAIKELKEFKKKSDDEFMERISRMIKHDLT